MGTQVNDSFELLKTRGNELDQIVTFFTPEHQKSKAPQWLSGIAADL